MQRFFASLFEERQREPRDDFLSELVGADFEDLEGNVRKLEIPEMISIVQQLMVAGNEATAKGITEINARGTEHWGLFISPAGTTELSKPTKA